MAAYLTIPGVHGSMTALSGYPGAFDLYTFTFAPSRQNQLGNLVFTGNDNQAVKDLVAAAGTGQRFAAATLVVTLPSGKTEAQWKLTDVQLFATEMQVSEFTVTAAFHTLDMIAYNQPAGTGGRTKVEVNWDGVQNTGTGFSTLPLFHGTPATTIATLTDSSFSNLPTGTGPVAAPGLIDFGGGKIPAMSAAWDVRVGPGSGTTPRSSVDVGDFTLTSTVGAFSPQLLLAALSRSTIPDVMLATQIDSSNNKVVTGPGVFATWHLTGATVTSYQMHYAVNNTMTATFALAFTTVTMARRDAHRTTDGGTWDNAHGLTGTQFPLDGTPSSDLSAYLKQPHRPTTLVDFGGEQVGVAMSALQFAPPDRNGNRVGQLQVTLDLGDDTPRIVQALVGSHAFDRVNVVSTAGGTVSEAILRSVVLTSYTLETSSGPGLHFRQSVTLKFLSADLTYRDSKGKQVTAGWDGNGPATGPKTPTFTGNSRTTVAAALAAFAPASALDLGGRGDSLVGCDVVQRAGRPVLPDQRCDDCGGAPAAAGAGERPAPAAGRPAQPGPDEQPHRLGTHGRGGHRLPPCRDAGRQESTAGGVDPALPRAADGLHSRRDDGCAAGQLGWGNYGAHWPAAAAGPARSGGGAGSHQEQRSDRAVLGRGARHNRDNGRAGGHRPRPGDGRNRCAVGPPIPGAGIGHAAGPGDLHLVH
jgi:type VI protein secretion system component Hcp